MSSVKKDFKKWHTRKSFLHENKARPFFNEKEIWFCSLGINVGFEQDGAGDNFLRPVVILRKFNNEIFFGIPTTKKNKKGPYYFRFSFQKNQSSSAILSQIRLIDAKRLLYKIGTLSENDFEEMKKRLISLLK